MILLYNFLQIAALVLLFPIILPVVLLKGKYRSRVAGRLGFGLRFLLPRRIRKKACIWVHALSVGEVRSCKPLLTALRNQFPDSTLLLSTTTATGRDTAISFGQLIDAVIPFPIDLWSSVTYFLNRIKPDIFVLVETDFWPNFLFHLQRRGIASFLVNGRISAKSSSAFLYHKGFFLPVFSSFSRLYMQTEHHAATMLRMGIEKKKVDCLGNLKYDAALEYVKIEPAGSIDPPIPRGQGLLIVAGSTHPGEEERLFRFFVRLRQNFPDTFLVVAPRDIGRAAQVMQLAAVHGLTCCRRSELPAADSVAVLVLDTFGELARCYKQSDIAFIGGSLVRQGGHNPLEAAVFGKPVLFGPHMDDFSEIRDDLLKTGGAVEVQSEDDLLNAVSVLWSDVELRRKTGQSALQTVRTNRGAAEAIAADMRNILSSPWGNGNGESRGEDDG